MVSNGQPDAYIDMMLYTFLVKARRVIPEPSHTE